MVKNVKYLSKEDIEELFYGEAHFCSLGCVFNEVIISFWKENILRQEIGHYHNAPLISRIGMACYEGLGDAILKNKYYEDAIKNNLLIKNITFPYISPIEYIISYLDTVWIKGCKRAIFENHKTFWAT